MGCSCLDIYAMHHVMSYNDRNNTRDCKDKYVFKNNSVRYRKEKRYKATHKVSRVTILLCNIMEPESTM